MLLFIFVTLPVINSFLLTLYLADGDTFSLLSFFQLGLTSATILLGLLSSKANSNTQIGVATPDEAKVLSKSLSLYRLNFELSYTLDRYIVKLLDILNDYEALFFQCSLTVTVDELEDFIFLTRPIGRLTF